MSDLEITKLCAEAMGIPFHRVDGRSDNGSISFSLCVYDPLHDDAQAMAIVKKFGLNIAHYYWDDPEVLKYDAHQQLLASARNKDLNRAICECVARISTPDSDSR